MSNAHPDDFDRDLRINTDLPFDDVLGRMLGVDDADPDDTDANDDE
jgi:hypothetical protein